MKKRESIVIVSNGSGESESSSISRVCLEAFDGSGMVVVYIQAPEGGKNNRGSYFGAFGRRQIGSPVG